MTHIHRVGKHAPKHDDRTLRMAQFLVGNELPEPPPALSHADKVSSWPMYDNDKIGDCTCAAAAHMIQLHSALELGHARPSKAAIVGTYRTLSPKDEGMPMLDVLNFWRKTGFAGHKLFAFAAVDLRSHEQVKLAVQMFGGVYLGLNLPLSAQDQAGPELVMDVPHGGAHSHKGAPGGWGGHAVNVIGYDAKGLEIVTWGAVQRITWAFWFHYADEAYVALSKDWERTPEKAGIDFKALQAAIAKFTKVPA